MANVDGDETIGRTANQEADLQIDVRQSIRQNYANHN